MENNNPYLDFNATGAERLQLAGRRQVPGRTQFRLPS